MDSSKQNENVYQAAFAQSRSKLACLTIDEIEHRSLCPYDATTDCFKIISLGRTFQVSYPAGIIKWATTGKDVPLDWALVLLNYLSSSVSKPAAGQWVTYRELLSGQVFYANLKRYVLDELSNFYSRCDKNVLWVSLEKSGFTQVENIAELNLQISFTPRVPVLLQFWDGDEDLPASCQILFDRNATEQLHIEDLAVVCGIIKRRLTRAYSTAD